VSLADLQNDEDHAFRKVKLRVDEKPRGALKVVCLQALQDRP
jgi:ribosomal protein S3AE